MNNLQKTALFFLYAFSAGLFLWIYIASSTFNGNANARYVDLVYQRASKPYVYRMIVPATIRAVSRLIPDKIERKINRTLTSDETLKSYLATLNWEPEHFHLYLIGMVVLYIYLLGFLLAMRYLFSGLFQVPWIIEGFVPVVVLPALLPWVNVTYIYDFSSLFFFTLGLALLLRAKWKWFLVIYTISCFNKETALLLTMQFGLFFGLRYKLQRNFFWRMIVVQLVIFVFSRILLTGLFWNNSGSLVEFHFLDHNLPKIWFFILKHSPTTLYLILMIILLFLYDWNDQPAFLRDGTWLLIPLILLSFLFGWVDEWRVYLEAFPIVICIFLHNAAKIIKIPVKKIKGYSYEQMDTMVTQASV